MMKSIVLGGGCFWCLEAVYQRVRGVESVQSGYSGGHVDNPDYRSVCSESTGHAEVVEVKYKDSEISLAELLDIFFTIHDPTTLNQQGNDRGTQYRSIALFESDDDKQVVEQVMQDKAKDFSSPIVTEVKPLEKFWPAETAHDNYYNNNANQPYCQIVVGSKVAKLKQYFSDKLVDE
jgi:peptide-methionine (S)-S-oxide reductase